MRPFLAIIPVQDNLTRLTDIALKKIGGWSLLRYSIEAACDITAPSLVYVVGSNKAVQTEAEALGTKSLLYPEKEFQSFDRNLDLLKHCLQKIEEKSAQPIPEYAVLLQPAYPFRLREDLQKASNLVNSSLNPDFVVSVKPLRDKVSWHENAESNTSSRKLVVNAGSFYFFRISAFLQEQTLIGKNTISVTLSDPELETIIKTEEDFVSAQALFQSISSRLDFKPFQQQTPDSHQTENDLSASR